MANLTGLPENPSLLNIQDEIDGIKHLAEAVWMAAGDVGDRNCVSALRAVQEVVTDRLQAVSDALDAIRHGKPDGGEEAK